MHKIQETIVDDDGFFGIGHQINNRVEKNILLDFTIQYLANYFLLFLSPFDDHFWTTVYNLTIKGYL